MREYDDIPTPRKWKMRDGKKVLIRQMETSHILNCIKMLDRIERNRISSAWMFAGFLHGEMATDAAESEISNMEENGFPDLEVYRFAFNQELERRKRGK